MNTESPHRTAGTGHEHETDADCHDSTVASESTIAGEDVEGRGRGETKPVDVSTEGGYGWVCVGCVFLINGHTWGLNSTYGVFLAHYLANDIFPGATSLQYALVGGLSISLALIVSPIATICTRKFGTQATLSVGIMFQTVALLGASWATEIYQLFLAQGVCFGWGMGFLFVASVGVVPQWFSKRRSFANSIATAGSGMGGLVYSLATNAMIQSIGLGWAFRVLAILSCAVNAICTVLIRDRNKAVGSVQLAFDFRLFKRPEFLLLLGWGFFSMLGYIVLLFSLPSYARSIGLTASQGSVVAAILNLGQGIGRPLVGYFSDRTGRINMAGTSTFLAGFFSLVIWIFAKRYGVLVFFALIVGTVSGTFWATAAPVGAEVVGLQILPSALSIMWVVLAVPCTFAEPIGLELRTMSGDTFLHAQIFTGFMYVAAAGCLLCLRAWKISKLEEITLDREKRSQALPNDNAVLANISRQESKPTSVKSMAKATTALWTWARV